MYSITSLEQLGPKTLEIESVSLLREIRQKRTYPLTEESVANAFGPYFVKPETVSMMMDTNTEISQLHERLHALFLLGDPVFEQINLQRVAHILSEIPSNMKANLEYANQVNNSTAQFVTDAVSLLNSIPHLRTMDEKRAGNEKAKVMFGMLLRTPDCASFRSSDIIHDGHLQHIRDLHRSLGQGYLFHVTLEEELRHVTFEKIRYRLSSERLAQAAEVAKSVERILHGVEAAYALNMGMIEWATVLYSYIKWLRSLTN